MQLNSYIDVGNNVREFSPGVISEIVKSVYKVAQLAQQKGMEAVIRTELGFLADYIEDAPIVRID